MVNSDNSTEPDKCLGISENGVSEKGNWENEFRKIASYTLLGLLTIFVAAIMVLLVYRDVVDGSWYAIAKEHFSAVIGLPCAATAAYAIVKSFTDTKEKITFKVIGLELSGQSNSVILWAVCFLSITISIKLLW